MNKRSEDTEARIARTKELIKDRLQNRDSGISFTWRDIPLTVDWIEGVGENSIAIVDARIGRLPMPKQNPVGRQQALILANHHSDKLGGRYIVRRNGEVLYRARMRLARPQSTEERAALAARLVIHLRPCLTEMRAYVLSGPAALDKGFRRKLGED